MPIHIIILNNDSEEAGNIKSWLEKDMRIPWLLTHCVTIEEACTRINKADLVILKPEMRGFTSPGQVFKDIDAMLFEVPIIVITSPNDERGLSTYVMEQGAADTIIRGQFSRLVDAIEFALIRQKLQTGTREISDSTLLDSQNTSSADLEQSRIETADSNERNKQILRMLGGDYAVDQ